MGRGLLLIVSGFIIIFGLIQNTTQSRQRILAERSPEYFYEKQTSNIASTMLEVAIGKLNSANNSQAIYVANNMDGTTEEVLGEGNGTGYIYTDAIQVLGSRIILHTIGEVEKSNGSLVRTTIKAELNRNAFSVFSYFTDIEPTIYFASGDVITGPVHSNGTFNIRGEPVFNGPVTSPHDWEDGGHYANPNFNGGSDFNAHEIPFPSEATDADSLSKNGGLHFNEKVKVEFKDDATADITTYEDTGARQCVRYNFFGCAKYEKVYNEIMNNYNLQDPNFNGVISADGDVEVKGTLDGQITLHSKKNIHIIGDVRYKNRNYDDKSDPNGISDDLLGMVSDGNTLIDDGAEKDHGNFDLDVDATVMTLGESFEVSDGGLLDIRGQLNILGGIIQKRRGTVAYGNDGGITRGYAKNYTYDTRFLENSTEGFPRQERFLVRYWEETTEKIPAGN